MKFENDSIEVVDVGVDFRDGSGIFVGLILLAVAAFVKPINKGWILVAAGILLVLCGLFVFLKYIALKMPR